MDTQPGFSFSFIKRVTQKLDLIIVNYRCFVPVYFQKKLSLNKLDHTSHYTFSCSFAFTQNNQVVGITDKFMTSLLKFLVEFVKHYIAQQWT